MTNFTAAYLSGALFIRQLLLSLAEGDDPAQQLVGFDEQAGAKQEGEQVGPIGVVVGGGDHVLDEGVQRARD